MKTLKVRRYTQVYPPTERGRQVKWFPNIARMPRKSPNALTWARTRARAMAHVAWRDEKIDELLAARNKVAGELVEARKRLAEAPDVPSFEAYVHAEHRIHSHMRDRNYPDRGNVVTRKLKSYSFAQSHGVAIPQIFGVWDRPEDISWDNLPDEVVLKSHTGSNGRGVFPLRRLGGQWTMVTGTETITPAEIVDRLHALKREGRVGGPFFAEELLSGVDANTLPVDVKVSTFYGEVGHILLRRAASHGDSRSTAFRVIFPDGTDPGHILRRHPYDPTIPIPENLDELVKVAARLSLGIPSAYLRVDLYDLDGRIVFGEFTPRPGGHQDFGPAHDARLGHLWERAHARVLNDVIDGADYILRFGSGPRSLLAGEKSFLPPADD